ncbi:MAG: hypothetical protein H2069_09095 [Legionella sp.]|nr:hypothetical protein [Legionella sp.]
MPKPTLYPDKYPINQRYSQLMLQVGLLRPKDKEMDVSSHKKRALELLYRGLTNEHKELKKSLKNYDKCRGAFYDQLMSCVIDLEFLQRQIHVGTGLVFEGSPRPLMEVITKSFDALDLDSLEKNGLDFKARNFVGFQITKLKEKANALANAEVHVKKATQLFKYNSLSLIEKTRQYLNQKGCDDFFHGLKKNILKLVHFIMKTQQRAKQQPEEVIEPLPTKVNDLFNEIRKWFPPPVEQEIEKTPALGFA